jgi:hypothetical protein
MIPASDRAMLIDGAEICLIVEENAAIVNRTESHHRIPAFETDPKRIMGRH